MSLGIVNPKKRREIEGVSSTSLIDLKATLFSAEENVRSPMPQCILLSCVN